MNGQRHRECAVCSISHFALRLASMIGLSYTVLFLDNVFSSLEYKRVTLQFPMWLMNEGHVKAVDRSCERVRISVQ